MMVIFIVWIVFIPLEQKPNLKRIKKVCKNKDFCNVIMLSENIKLWEFNHQRSDKAPFIIYSDLQFIIEKIDGYKNNPENLSLGNVSKHIPPGFSIVTILSVKSIENKHDVYRGKIAWKSFANP